MTRIISTMRITTFRCSRTVHHTFGHDEALSRRQFHNIGRKLGTEKTLPVQQFGLAE